MRKPHFPVQPGDHELSGSSVARQLQWLIDVPVNQATEGKRPFRIVMTGGPGGGKTTAAELLRRELGARLVVVPESATILFTGGFPRSTQADAQISAQRAIFHVQRSLEDVQSQLYPNRILLCDRGTVDGAAYWPEHHGDFFQRMHTTIEQELSRYDAVVFFESAAVADLSIEGGNPIRNESSNEARLLDARLRRLWCRHPHFVFVPHDTSFIRKTMTALTVLQAIIAELPNAS